MRLQNIAANVRIDVQKSDLVRAAGIKGNVEMQSNHGGDIEVDGVEGEVVVNGSYSGDVQFRNCSKPVRFQSPQTELRVAKLPGQIHMSLGEFNGSNLVGPVFLNSNRPKDVQIEQFTQALDLRLEHGDVSLRPMTSPMPKIDAHTQSGQIELALPEAAKFSLKATTNRGELNNDFGSALRTEYQNDRRPDGGGTIMGSVGQGAAIALSTARGTITIRKDSSEVAEPPKPPKPPKADRAAVPDPPKPPAEIEQH